MKTRGSKMPTTKMQVSCHDIGSSLVGVALAMDEEETTRPSTTTLELHGEEGTEAASSAVGERLTDVEEVG